MAKYNCQSRPCQMAGCRAEAFGGERPAREDADTIYYHPDPAKAPLRIHRGREGAFVGSGSGGYSRFCAKRAAGRPVK